MYGAVATSVFYVTCCILRSSMPYCCMPANAEHQGCCGVVLVGQKNMRNISLAPILLIMRRAYMNKAGGGIKLTVEKPQF